MFSANQQHIISDTDERGHFMGRFNYPEICDYDEDTEKRIKEDAKEQRALIAKRGGGTRQTVAQKMPVDQPIFGPDRKPIDERASHVVDSICVASIQAHIFNASQVSATSSNVVHWEVKQR